MGGSGVAGAEVGERKWREWEGGRREEGGWRERGGRREEGGKGEIEKAGWMWEEVESEFPDARLLIFVLGRLTDLWVREMKDGCGGGVKFEVAI